jgi:hypothetical protein
MPHHEGVQPQDQMRPKDLHPIPKNHTLSRDENKEIFDELPNF